MFNFESSRCLVQCEIRSLWWRLLHPHMILQTDISHNTRQFFPSSNLLTECSPRDLCKGLLPLQPGTHRQSSLLHDLLVVSTCSYELHLALPEMWSLPDHLPVYVVSTLSLPVLYCLPGPQWSPPRLHLWPSVVPSWISIIQLLGLYCWNGFFEVNAVIYLYSYAECSSCLYFHRSPSHALSDQKKALSVSVADRWIPFSVLAG